MEVFIIIGLILLNGILSMSEIAMVSARKPRLEADAKRGSRAAKTALKKYYRGKRFLPNAFSSQNHIEEIKGVYVPFWMYDGEASGSVEFHATTVHKYTSGDYEVTEISHYDVRRAGSISFEKSRWMRRAKCRMITWTPSNRSTMRT